MTIAIDRKYIDLLSSSLLLFKWETKNTAVCRCPVCGDSKTKKFKKRGYFYQIDVDNYNFKCHNCGCSMRLQTLLKQLDHSLYDRYMYDKFQYSNEYKWFNHNQQKKTEKVQKYYKGKHAISSLKTVSELEDSHFCKLYCIKRKIPEQFWSMLYYTDNYMKWICDSVSPDKFKKLPEKDERLVIPFFTKNKTPFAFQGRYIGDKSIESSLRYITINESGYPLIYGLDRIDMTKDISIVEGPIDSLFVNNCLAAAGSTLSKIKKARKIFDNQPRNKEVVNLIDQSIQQGFPVVIWDDSMTAKDINDLVKDYNWSIQQVNQYLDNRTFNGLKAKLEFEQWKKI